MRSNVALVGETGEVGQIGGANTVEDLPQLGTGGAIDGKARAVDQAGEVCAKHGHKGVQVGWPAAAESV
jgi:hypothetical protein